MKTATDQEATNMIQFTHYSEGLDEMGTETATVCVKSGTLLALHTSYRRGGCLNAGTVTLLNVATDAVREIDVTSWARKSDTHAAYLIGLAEKHVGSSK